MATFIMYVFHTQLPTPSQGALSKALGSARTEEALGRSSPDPGPARHALLVAKDLKSLSAYCEAALEGSGVCLLEVTDQMTPEHAWCQQRDPNRSQ